jgi:hypothetical protein
MELMLYAFDVPANDSGVTLENISFYLDLIGDSILPFLRALIQLKWETAPQAGDLIFRQNAQYTLICRLLLRTLSEGYCDILCTEFLRLVDENADRIQAVPIATASDATAFLDKIFDPFLQFFLDSIPKMPKFCRVLYRLLLVRTTGFYVSQRAAFLILPNLFVLRFVIPPITEAAVKTFATDPKKKRIASMLYGSLLSTTNGLGWQEDKEPFMLNFQHRIEKRYPHVLEFSQKLCDCHEMEYTPPPRDAKWNALELLGPVAKRVISMNLKSANSMIHSHIYSVSLMHMIEEWVYEFGPEISE